MTDKIKQAREDIADNIHPDGRISVMGGMQLLQPETIETVMALLTALEKASEIEGLEEAVERLQCYKTLAASMPDNNFAQANGIIWEAALLVVAAKKGGE